MRTLVRPALLAAVLLVVFASTALAQGEAVKGRLVNDGQPIAGVQITVAAAAGEVIGTATTDVNGEWTLSLPGPGDYVARLDQATLPAGLGLTEPERARLDFSIRSGQERTLLFALGTALEGGDQVTRFLQLVADGVKLGVIIAITSIGLSLIFGTTGLVNFAHGELVTLGAVIAYVFSSAAGGPMLPLVAASLVAIALGALFAAGLDRFLWRPLRLRRSGLVALLVVSIGLSMLVRHGILLFFGDRALPFREFAVQRTIPIGPIGLAPKEIAILILSVAVLVGVALLLERTRVGTAMRAVADNRDLAETSGIDVQRVVLGVWALGGALAAVGGVFLGLVDNVSWSMGYDLLLLMFAAVILGGLGSAYGAMVGGLVVGLVTQLSTFWLSIELKSLWALAVLIVILLVRPQGILGQRERVG